MKTLVKNNQGIALVTSLMLTLISLTIIMAVMYMITQSVQQSGMVKRYKTALEASYGGTDIMMKEIIPDIMSFTEAGVIPFDDLEDKYSLISMITAGGDPDRQSCFMRKLTLPTSEWQLAPECVAENQSVDPRVRPDLEFNMQAVSGAPYTVFTKIVDSTGPGNSDRSNIQLEGAGTAETLTVMSPKSLPGVYRIEIQAERSANAVEQGNISVLYAY